jgi:hypothetical protein
MYLKETVYKWIHFTNLIPILTPMNTRGSFGAAAFFGASPSPVSAVGSPSPSDVAPPVLNE